MTKEATRVIIVYERVWKSWARDFGTFLTFAALIYLGVVLNSSAMQWVGAIIGFISIFARSVSFYQKSKVSIQEARKRLDEIEASEQAA